MSFHSHVWSFIYLRIWAPFKNTVLAVLWNLHKWFHAINSILSLTIPPSGLLARSPQVAQQRHSSLLLTAAWYSIILHSPPPPPKDTWLARILTTTHTSLHVSPVHLLETPRSCTPVVCEGQRWGARPSVRRSAGLSGHGLHFPPIGPEGSFPPPHSYLIGFRFPNFCQSEGIKWYLLIWIWVEEIK